MLEQVQKIILTAKVRSLENQISTLLQEMTKLEEQKAKYESELAPIWMVPFETLSYIFELVHREETTKELELQLPLDFDLPKFKSTFSIKISHVSRHFRNVAIKTHALWTVIHIRNVSAAQLNYVKTCIDRSGSLPFNFKLNFHSDPGPAIVVKAMMLIKANTHRLKRFAAYMNYDDPLLQYLVGRFLDQPAPQLVALSLFQPNRGSVLQNEDSPEGPCIPFRNGMDKLTELRLSYVPLSWSQMTFKNLVIIYLQGLRLTHQEFWSIINSNASSLRRLVLQDFEIQQSSLVSELDIHDPYALNSLEDLQLLFVSLDVSLVLMSHIRAPRLRSLVLYALDEGDFSIFFDQILGPPLLFPHLISLHIIGVNATHAIVRRLRRAYQSRLPLWYFRTNRGSENITLYADIEDNDTATATSNADNDNVASGNDDNAIYEENDV